MAEKIIKILHRSAIIILSVSILICTIHFMLNPTFVGKLDDNTPVKIANSYFDKFLSLSDYKVTEAVFKDFYGEKYIQVNYSIKPKKGYVSRWKGGGSGEEAKDGWIVDNFIYIRFMRIGPIAVTLSSCTGI